MSGDYLLGVAPEEIARLTQQHAAWRDVTERLWDLAGSRAARRWSTSAAGLA